jgi:SAM-dependent methyltransferase
MTFALHALVFVGAFLLFLVEPLIAKAILPWFGGGAGVWTACMLFFQLALLAGYTYAHGISGRLSPGARTWVHVGLLAISVALLPIIPSDRWKPTGTGQPELEILGLLTATLGLPFLLLSSTSPLVQAWAARLRPSTTPFRLYASSNLGSLLALPAYPVLVEPTLGTVAQARTWSAAYAGFALAMGALALAARRAAAPTITRSGTVTTDREVRSLWFSLPACSSTLLLGITNRLCQDVAAVPFLFLIPLAIYLATFVACFADDRWYHRAWCLRGLPIAVSAVLAGDVLFPSLALVALHGAALFLGCMVCHGELARLRPSAAGLTAFYLISSLGGAVGALFVGIVAPRIFTGYWELEVATAAVLPLALLAAAHDPASPFAGSHRSVRRASALLLVGMGIAVVIAVRSDTGNAFLAARNFYGVLRVQDGPGVRSLVHGVTNHGSQFVGDRRHEPTAYYGRSAGVGLAFARHRPLVSRYVGIVGLGAGNLAAYGQPGDRFRFYEINPLVAEIARRDFSFLADSSATIEVVIGDARLELEREAPQGFDLLVVDAFSSDSIPVHCITREAFALYDRHLAPGGLIAVHVSNRYLDLEPVVGEAARVLGLSAIVVESRPDAAHALLAAAWILIGSDPAFFGDPRVLALSRPTKARGLAWSDDFSSLFEVLR